jgi:ZIP family zinc transporter
MAMSNEQIFFGFILTVFAGLSTTIGAIVVFIMKKPSPKFIGLFMGFSAGVMIGVSIFKMLPESIENLGVLVGGISFLLGMITVALLDFLIPHEYMQERSSIEENVNDFKDIMKNGRLMRTGSLLAIGITIHNFPEGFVTMTGSFKSLELGLLLAVAIAFHNIPEGLVVAMPIYIASGSKKKAFGLSFLSGIAEPFGAIISIIILTTFGTISPNIIELSLAFVAGIMMFISLDELLPSAHESCNDNGDTTHTITIGIIAGLAIMLITIFLL